MDKQKDKDDKVKTDEERPMLYGIGGCTPGWLQWCTSPKMALIWLSWFALIQGSTSTSLMKH